MKRRATYSDEVVYDDRIEIGKAVRASSSYPGVFIPCEYNGIRLIDGGLRENTPWREWKKVGVDKVICIGFETQKETKEETAALCSDILAELGIEYRVAMFSSADDLEGRLLTGERFDLL